MYIDRRVVDLTSDPRASMLDADGSIPKSEFRLEARRLAAFYYSTDVFSTDTIVGAVLLRQYSRLLLFLESGAFTHPDVHLIVADDHVAVLAFQQILLQFVVR